MRLRLTSPWVLAAAGVALLAATRPEREPDAPAARDAAVSGEMSGVATLRGAGRALEPSREGAEGASVPSEPASGDAASLVARVRDERDAPVAGVRVTVRIAGSDAVRREDRTGGDGTVRFEGLPAGEHRVEATAGGERAGFSDPWLESGRERSVTIRLVPHHAVAGVVLLPTGEPARGATVEARRGGAAEGETSVDLDQRPIARTTTDGEGRFVLRLGQSRRVTIAARADPFAEGTFSLRVRNARDDLVLRLVDAGTVAGRVRNPDGSPSAGARVFVVPASVADFLEDPRQAVAPGVAATRWTADDDDATGGSASSTGEAPIHRPALARTDEGGSFRVGPLPLGRRYRVLAEGRDGSRGASPEFGLDARDRDAGAEVRLEVRTSLRVRLVARDGSPLPPCEECRIVLRGAREHFLEPRDADSWIDPYVGHPSDGVVFSGLVPGRYEVVARVPGSAPLAEWIEATAGEVAEATLRLREGRSIECLVVDSEGRPLPDAAVAFRADDAPPYDDGTSGRTDEGGRVRLEGLPDEIGDLRAESATHLPAKVERIRPGPDPARIALERRPEVRFRLSGGIEAPPGGLRATAFAHPYPTALEASRAGDGEWSCFLPVADVETSLYLHVPGAATLRVGRFRLGAGEVARAGSLEIDAGRELAGRVTDASGAPLGGVEVWCSVPEQLLELALSGPFSTHAPRAESDAQGRFLLHGVPRCAVRILARHAAHAPFDVPCDEGVRSVDLALPRPAFVEATLRDSNGGPAPGVLVLVGRMRGEETPRWPERAVTDEAGLVRFGPLASGEYVAECQEAGGAKRVLARFRLGEGERRTEEWRLP